VGTLFIEQIPNIPQSPASPYQSLTYRELVRVMALRAHAQKHDIYEVERLVPEARRCRRKSQNELLKLMDRNVFLNESET